MPISLYFSKYIDSHKQMGSQILRHIAIYIYSYFNLSIWIANYTYRNIYLAIKIERYLFADGWIDI